MAYPAEAAFAGPLPQLIALEPYYIVFSAFGEEERRGAADNTAAHDQGRGAGYSATSS